ncbi:MAG TPA: phosphonatase-like hydrolase [Puia sp.]|jgi:phosphonatase-like hydrolase|nr:phosphonatase-like hydrolase [Puia sp.]
MIKMIVFDMAGTTVNENMVVYKTLQQAINEAGFDLTFEQVLAEGAGKEKVDAIKSILRVYANQQDDALTQNIYQHFIAALASAYDTEKILPQDHAEELFLALKQRNILVVLNTGYNEKTAQQLITKLGWKKGGQFDSLVTATDVERNRPYPDMIRLAMKQFGIADAADVVKVGDSIIDIEEGANAGCGINIGITTGAHTREQLESANPDHIIDDLLELLPLIHLQ